MAPDDAEEGCSFFIVLASIVAIVWGAFSTSMGLGAMVCGAMGLWVARFIWKAGGDSHG